MFNSFDFIIIIYIIGANIGTAPGGGRSFQKNIGEMWQCDGQRTDWCTDKTALIIIIIPIAAVSNIICQLSLIEMFCVVSGWNERSIALQANLLPRVAGMLPQRDTDGMSTAAPIDVEDSSSDDDSWIFWLHRKSHLQIHFALRTTHCTLHTPHFTLHSSHSRLHFTRRS